MANPYLNQILHETTKLTNPDDKTPARPLTDDDKAFLTGAMDSIKGHNDVVKEIEQKMETVDLILENFEELEEYAFDIDLAYCMNLFGLFQKVEQTGYNNIELLTLASIACQNNEKVQTANTKFLVKYLYYLRTYRDFRIKNVDSQNTKVDVKIKDKSGDEIVLKPANVSLLSALVRSHDNNESLFKKSGGLSLLVDLMGCSEFVENHRMMTKILFFYKSVASKDEVLIGLDPERLFKLHGDSVEYSRMLVEIFEMVGGSEKWKDFEGEIKKRRQVLEG